MLLQRKQGQKKTQRVVKGRQRHQIIAQLVYINCITEHPNTQRRSWRRVRLRFLPGCKTKGQPLGRHYDEYYELFFSDWGRAIKQNLWLEVQQFGKVDSYAPGKTAVIRAGNTQSDDSDWGAVARNKDPFSTDQTGGGQAIVDNSFSDLEELIWTEIKRRRKWKDKLDRGISRVKRVWKGTARMQG